jgi:hypothetical protein
MNKKPALHETYEILPKNPSELENERFILKVIDPDNELYDWVFQINGLSLNENEEEDEARMIIDYDILEAPEELPETYDSSEDDRIVTSLGDIILDILEMALENNKFAIQPQEESEISNDSDNDTTS